MIKKFFKKLWFWLDVHIDYRYFEIAISSEQSVAMYSSEENFIQAVLDIKEEYGVL